MVYSGPQIDSGMVANTFRMGFSCSIYLGVNKYGFYRLYNLQSLLCAQPEEFFGPKNYNKVKETT